MKLTIKAQEIALTFKELKERSGSHSPSVDVLLEQSNTKLTIDACFLSNPYATQLFMDEFIDKYPTTKSLLHLIENYPPQNKDVAQKISKTIDIPQSNILVGNGAEEIIEWILSQKVKSSIALPIPTFSSYYEAVSDNVKVNFFQLEALEDFALNLTKYSEFINETRSNSAIIINPNNPNGDYISQTEIFKFCQQNTHLDYIIIDDSFSHFAFENDELKLVSNSYLAIEFSNVVVIKSMSKDFGVAGIRAGYAVMPKTVVEDALNRGFLWNSNGFSSNFFNIWSDPEFQTKYEVVRKKYIVNTLHMANELSKIPQLKTLKSKSNFFLVRVAEDELGSFGFNLLAEYGIYIRNCNDKLGLDKGYYRIASRTFEENLIIVNSIKTLLC